MHARRHLWLMVIGLAGLALACTGGSGSSGFENAAIMDALNEQRCVEVDGLMVCPADSVPTHTPAPPTPTATHTPSSPVDTPVTPSLTPPVKPSPSETSPISGTPTPTASTTRAQMTATATPTVVEMLGPAVDTALGGRQSVPCVLESTGESCSFVFSFAPQGFPPTAVFRVAVRGTVKEPWTILPDPIQVGGEPQASFENDVGVAFPGDSQSDAMVQLAVLVFLETPPPLPETVRELSETGAYRAYLTPEVMVTSD